MTSRGRGGGGKGWLSPPRAGAGAMLEGAKHPAAFPQASPLQGPAGVGSDVTSKAPDGVLRACPRASPGSRGGPGPAQHPVPPSPPACRYPAPTKRPPAPTRKARCPTSRSRGRRWARIRSHPRPSPDPAAAPSWRCRRKQRSTGSWGVLENPPESQRLAWKRRQAAGT